MDIGAHCSIGSCNQQDFLPFTCDCCNSVFCLHHRTYDAHECPNAGSRDRRVVQCPLCQKFIRWTAEQDVNMIWEQHMNDGQCKPSTKDNSTEAVTKGKKKSRCGAENCREVLLVSNQFHCPKCNTNVCLRHRFEADHNCEGRRQHHRHHRAVSYTNRATKPTASKQSSQTAQATASMAVASTKAAMQTLVQKGKSAAAAVSNAASSSLVTSTTEQCPICQQKFAYVSQLIAHVNRMHPDVDTRARSAPTTSSGSERCPHCSSSFQDVMKLIEHVERTHPQPTIQTQAIAAGGRNNSSSGEDKCMVM